MFSGTEIASTPVMVEAPVGNLLVVDEERSIRETCIDAAKACGYMAYTVDGAESAYSFLEEHAIDVVLLELKLSSGGCGLEVLQRVRQLRPGAVVIIMTGTTTVRSAVEAMKLGAHDLLTKPFSAGGLRRHLRALAGDLQETAERRVLREQMRSKHGFGAIVGQSPEMERLYRTIAKASQATHPVLILGENGTGKELVARAIHHSGPNKDKAFVPVDCGLMVPSQIESELFGGVKCESTGALRPKDGLLGTDGGTVFLNAIFRLPLDLQAKLLRAIQEHEIGPVGSTKQVPIKVRIVAAANCDLECAVLEGRLRRDLYNRLNVLTLRIPPLRERRSDIPLLVAHFLDRMASTAGIRYALSDEALKAIADYDWPGNVRELENCLERACALSSGSALQVTDLPAPFKQANSGTPVAEPRHDNPIRPIAELEKMAVLNAIDQLKGDKLAAAKMLGIGKTTLYRKLKEYGCSN